MSVHSCNAKVIYELESQLAAAKAENKRYREALESIERWCKSIKPNYVPSRFATGCVTPDGQSVLSENLGNIARAALAHEAGRAEIERARQEYKETGGVPFDDAGKSTDED